MDNNSENKNDDKVVDNLIEINSDSIKDLIYTIRGKQVMIDRDLAILYQVETRALKQAVKRNIDKFPDDFMFRLTDDEIDLMVSQNVIPSKQHLGGSKPYIFTESGIAMLSSVLRSDIAMKVSVAIMRTFVEMRKFLINNQALFSRLDRVELRQLEHSKRLDKNDKKFEKVFDYIAENKEVKQKIFFNGQIYDAFSLLVDVVKQADNSIILIDNYVGVDTLNILAKKKDGVTVDIFTTKKSNLTKNDIRKFNLQYKNLQIKEINTFHDRFMILDENICYHIGASIKDVGKKSFAISKIEDKQNISDILSRL